jgi:hypothetical protein
MICRWRNNCNRFAQAYVKKVWKMSLGANPMDLKRGIDKAEAIAKRT